MRIIHLLFWTFINLNLYLYHILTYSYWRNLPLYSIVYHKIFSKYLSESLLDEKLTVIFHLSVLNKYTQDMVWRKGNCLWTYLNPPPKLWFINCHFLSRRVTCIHSHVFVLFHPMFATIWSIYFLTFKFCMFRNDSILWNSIN